jgi:hypothetical protein
MEVFSEEIQQRLLRLVGIRAFEAVAGAFHREQLRFDTA